RSFDLLERARVAGGVMCPHDEEGGARGTPLTGQAEPRDGLIVCPPGAGRPVPIRVLTTQPGRACVGPSVHAVPGQVQAAHQTIATVPLVGLGQGAVDQYQAESAGGPEGGLTEAVGSTGGRGLSAVQLAAEDRGELSVLVLVPGQAGGVVVLDAEQGEGVRLPEFVQTAPQHTADLLCPFEGGLEVLFQVVPA